MKIAFSYEAQDDLLEIHKWIHKDNPKQANCFIDELEVVCGALAEMPQAFPVVFEDTTWPIRRRAWRNYLIFYRIEESQIVVLRVGHAAQNWSRNQFDD